MDGCATFDTTVKNLHKVMERGKVSIETDCKHVMVNCARGRLTAFYDAVVDGVERLKGAERYLRGRKDGQRMPEWEHVVITDGGGNSSAASLEEVAALVAKPGLRDYQFVVIGVGLSESVARNLAQICRPAHCHFHREPDAAALSKRLCAMADGYKLRMTRQDRGGPAEVVEVGMKSAKDAAEALAAAGQALVRQLRPGGGPRAITCGSDARAITAGRCHHGAKCVKFGCKFAHPPGQRRPDCRDGGKCSRRGCHFLHPKQWHSG